MKRKSIGKLGDESKRQLAALRKMPDSQIDYSDIPRQDPNDPKWKNAVVGRPQRPVKTPVTVRLDGDIVAWLKSKGGHYQQHMNATLRAAMLAERKR